MVKDIKENDLGRATFLCSSKTKGLTKKKKEFLTLLLRDKTGEIEAKVWDLSSVKQNFSIGDFVSVSYSCCIFNDSLQLNVDSITVATEGTYNDEDFFPVSRMDNNKMWEALLQYVDGVEHVGYKTLLKAFFENKEFENKFRKHSAAKSAHHACVGGLLQHTLYVTMSCVDRSKRKKSLNKDLLTTGAIFHDVGKLEAYEAFPINDLTIKGRLFEHLMLGIFMVRDKAKELNCLTDEELDDLLHLIASHHGELEWGAITKPCLLEAVTLHFADNEDAREEMAENLLEQVEGPGLSEKSWALNTQFIKRK